MVDEVIVGIDGSEGSFDALRWAAREADLHGWGLTAVLAWDYLQQHHADGSAVFDPGYDSSEAERAMKAYLEQCGDLRPRPTPRVVCDLPARALIDAAQGARLLVVGARGLGGFRGLLLGSTSQHCLHHAPCPVAIVRTGATWRTSDERIVVGVDGSSGSTSALAWAVDEAVARGATLEAVAVGQLPYYAVDPYGVVPTTDPAMIAESARAVSAEALARVDASRLTRPIEHSVHTGGAAECILSAAKDADLVVLGSRGRGGFAGLLLGSVSAQVAHHAPCPVVIIREPKT